MRIRYRGPVVSEDEAIEIADQFAQAAGAPVGKQLSVVHQRPLIYGRENDKLSGVWAVTYESLAPPPPPNEVICPDPQSPIVVEVDDQTGTPEFWGSL